MLKEPAGLVLALPRCFARCGLAGRPWWASWVAGRSRL